MKTTLLVAVLLLFAAPAIAAETFGGMLYEKTIYVEEGTGGVSGSFRTGIRLPETNLWFGAQLVEVNDTKQGGLGPSVFWIDKVDWLGGHVSLIADLGYLSQIAIDPATGEYTWGPAGGIGVVIHGSEQTHLALGLRFYPDGSDGNFMDRVSFAGGLFFSDPYKQIGKLFGAIGGVLTGK